jgi:hypothetical protein
MWFLCNINVNGVRFWEKPVDRISAIIAFCSNYNDCREESSIPFEVSMETTEVTSAKS